MTDSDSNIIRFITRTLIGSIPLMILGVLILFYYFDRRPAMTGDLGALGKLRFDNIYHNSMLKPRTANDMPSIYQPGDSLPSIVTIGDSFSDQYPNGYQSFLADMLHCEITNIPLDSHLTDAIPGAFRLVNSGFFDNHPQVEWVIVECGEKSMLRQWLLADTLAVADPLPIINFKEIPDESVLTFSRRIFSQGIDWLKLSSGIVENPVKSIKLNRKCFTQPGKEDMLFFVKDDLKRLSASEAQLSEVDKRLKNLHSRFARRGIKMIYLIAPAKYGLYQHIAIDNPYPARLFSRQMSVFGNLDFVVNPYPVLKNAIDSGMKDVYMADDTHWSPEGAKIAAQLIANKIHEYENSGGE